MKLPSKSCSFQIFDFLFKVLYFKSELRAYTKTWLSSVKWRKIVLCLTSGLLCVSRKLKRSQSIILCLVSFLWQLFVSSRKGWKVLFSTRGNFSLCYQILILRITKNSIQKIQPCHFYYHFRLSSWIIYEANLIFIYVFFCFFCCIMHQLEYFICE